MTRTKRRQMIADHIAGRIRATAYRAWYISTLNTGKLTGTILKTLNKIR